MAIEGKIQIQADLVPTNLNPRGYVTEDVYIKGGPQTFDDVIGLAAFHPNRMKKGMTAKILNFPGVGSVSTFVMNADPAGLLDASGNTIITINNFQQFWTLETQTETSQIRVRQYSADGPGGGAPVFPYTIDEESNWSNTLDYTKGHRWLRFRDDDIDEDEDGIFDNWTAPLSIGNAFQGGDYIDKRFKRQNVSTASHVAVGTMTANKYYIVQAGTIQIVGDLELNEIGEYGANTTAILTSGRTFKYASANAYTFLGGAYVSEVIATPPRTLDGVTNDEPVGWDGEIPAGTEQLWAITGQKSVYGRLKSEWLLQKIIENPNYTRYSNSPSPHPDTLAGVNSPATTGTPEDLALLAAGWDTIYAGQTFIARRSDSAGPNDYTTWLVEKINDESGEYVANVYKLFDINLDPESPILTPPTNRDPSDEGFSDTPLPETDTQINYVSTAIKFFNGELKTSWSALIPYTGKSTFDDVIESDLGDNFKYSSTDVVTPEEITLQANLFRGTSKLWETTLGITYEWKKVYDGGAAVDIDPSTNPVDDFYLLEGDAMSPGIGLIRDNQRVVIKPGAVDGNAVFRCTQTLAMSEGDDIIFEEEFSILDVTDGKDAKSFVVTSDNDKCLYDSVNDVFLPENVLLRAYWSNIPSVTLKWYQWDGSAWDALTNGVGGFTLVGNTLSVSADTLFTNDNTGEEIRFAASMHATNPDLVDFDTTFSDYITIVKLSSAAVGTPGENAAAAILSNEAHTVVLLTTTGLPATGEVAKATTRVAVYHGTTKKNYHTSEFTITLDNVTQFAVTDPDDGTGDAVVSLVNASWVNGVRSYICKITATIASPAIVVVKTFSLASTKDAPGAILLDLDSNKGFVFNALDRTAKTLTAKLYDSSLTGTQEITLPNGALYEFRIKKAGVFSTWGTSNTFTINRSDVLVSSDIIVEVRKTGDVAAWRSRTIKMTDVLDGKTYRAFTQTAAAPSAPQKLTTQNPVFPGGNFGADGNSAVVLSGNSWYLQSSTFVNANPGTFYWEQEAQENADGTWTWYAPKQFKGEKGDQGLSSGFFFEMYRAVADGVTPVVPGAAGDPTTPSSDTATLATMQTAGWTAKIPSTGIIWKTSRFWIGEGVTFDAQLNPSTNPFSGSKWNPPVRLSAKDGTNGVGTNGLNGWSMVPAVVPGAAAGTKVIQVVDWIGGTGSKPGHIGEYVGSTGFTSVLASAQNVTGEPIQLQYNSTTKYLQWKYTSEGGGSWRNLYQYLPRLDMNAILQLTGRNGNDLTLSTAGTPGFRSYAGGSWTNTTGLTVVVEMNARIQARRDSGGNELVLFSVRTTINGGTVDVGTPDWYVINGNTEITLISTTVKSVAPGAVLAWVAQATVTGGGQCFLSDSVAWYVKILN